MQLSLFNEKDGDGVRKLIAAIMEEFNEELSFEMDRDLFDIHKFYEDGCFFVLKEGPDIIGTVALSKIVKCPAVAKLRRFYLRKDYRQRGFGRKMYLEMEAFARRNQYKELWTSTSPNHKEVITFLTVNGFKQTEDKLWKARRAKLFFKKELS
jgi:putative acetyltransferase